MISIVAGAGNDVRELRFSQPPVRTVSFELLFRTDVALSLSSTAGLLDRWSGEFPHVRESAPAPRGDVGTVGFIGDGDPWPFPLVELSGDDGRSVRMQADSVAVSWRFDPDSAVTYPGYGALRSSLEALLGEFIGHLGDKGTHVVLTGAACRYVNDISQYSPKQLMAGVVSGWVDEEPLVAADVGTLGYAGLRMIYEASPDLDGCSITIGIDPASPDSREGTQSILDISVQREGGGEEVSLSDLDIVHERLTLTFLNSSNSRLRTEWKQES